jgi:hypothetical protein
MFSPSFIHLKEEKLFSIFEYCLKMLNASKNAGEHVSKSELQTLLKIYDAIFKKFSRIGKRLDRLYRVKKPNRKHLTTFYHRFYRIDRALFEHAYFVLWIVPKQHSQMAYTRAAVWNFLRKWKLIKVGCAKSIYTISLSMFLIKKTLSVSWRFSRKCLIS